MSEKQTAEKTKPAGSQRKLALSELLPLVIFVLVLAVGLGAWGMQRSKQQEQRTALQKANSQLGLPPDYPSDVLPLYKGLEIASATKDQTKSQDGADMDRWTLKATSTEAAKPIYEYYNKLMLDQGLQQTMYISIPGGYGVDFADENQVINYVIEADPKQPEITNVEIKYHRVKH